MEARVADIAAHRARGTGLAAGAPPALHLRHQRQGRRPARPALSDVRHRARRAAHLSRPRPAGGLCHARPEAAAAGRPGLCRGSRGVDHPDARGLQRARRAARGSRRRLGGPAGQGRGLRGQDRRHRRAVAALGVVPRHLDQRGARPDAISTAIVPCGVADPRYGVTSLVDLGHTRDHGGCRCRAPAGIRGGVRRRRSSACRKRSDSCRSRFGQRRLAAAARYRVRAGFRRR